MKITIEIPDDKKDLILDGICSATGRPAESPITRENWVEGKLTMFVLNSAKNGQNKIRSMETANAVDQAGVAVKVEAAAVDAVKA